MVHVGIDLGTSNTVVAVTGSDGAPQIRTIDGSAMVPSVIHVSETGGARSFGDVALDEWANPDYDQAGSFRRWKLGMGEAVTLREMRFGGDRGDVTRITPELLTTWLVEYVLSELTEGVGGESVDSVLVTVPHGWRRENPEKCRATRQAAGAAVVDGKAITVQTVTVSEPVAAAVYWLWAARQNENHRAGDFVGKTVLVCDVGGGTFDLSLVRVGSEGEPLVVVDAINHNVAGDYVTALLMSHVARQYNAEHGASLPETAEGVLDLLAGSDDLWVRGWFREAQGLQKDMSLRFEQAATMPDRPVRAIVRHFGSPEGLDVKVTMGPEAFLEALEPFYQAGRDLARKFLEQHDDSTRPYAVVFAGGGSRIAGVADRVVRPVLADLVADPDEVMSRIAINDRMIDQAVALGAALVANGVVTVQERLLSDVGIESAVEPALAEALALPAGATRIILTPILAKGTVLPATFRASEHALPHWGAAPGESLDLSVVIDDDGTDPWVQGWQVQHPADGRREALSVVVEADSDGVLSITMTPPGGTETTVRGTLTRSRTGRASLVFYLSEDQRRGPMPRVSLEQLREALLVARKVK